MRCKFAVVTSTHQNPTLFAGGYSGLHRSGSVHADWVHVILRLVVSGRDHVRDAHRISAFLLGKPDRDLPQSHDLAGNARLSPGSTHFQPSQGFDSGLLLVRLSTAELYEIFSCLREKGFDGLVARVICSLGHVTAVTGPSELRNWGPCLLVPLACFCIL